jgi:uncharacterized protein YraI
MKRIALFALAAVALAGTVAPALAQPTARASATLAIFAAPNGSSEQIGRLDKGMEVDLERCTYGGKWCLVQNPYGNDGWVKAGYLVGSAAKLEATPYTPLVPFHHYEPVKEVK